MEIGFIEEENSPALRGLFLGGEMSATNNK